MGFGTWFLAVLTFWVVAVASSKLAFLFPKIKLPLITGYLFIGILAGPFCLDIVSPHMFESLSFITQFALAFISFSAGAELYLPELKRIYKTIALTTGGIAICTIVLCFSLIFAMFAVTSILPWIVPFKMQCKAGISLLATAIMCARSPASAIAIVKELKASGPFTKVMMGVTVVSDLLVLVVFAISTAIARPSCEDGYGFGIISLVLLLMSLAFAVITGTIVGRMLIFILWIPSKVKVNLPYITSHLGIKDLDLHPEALILPFGWSLFKLSEWFVDYTRVEFGHSVGLEPLLICIFAGYRATNMSRDRIKFLKLLQSAGPYIFVPFFTLVGAQLDLRVLIQSLGFGFVVCIIRMAAIASGTYSGARLSKSGPVFEKYQWMTLCTQAGVSLGLASEVAVQFDGWGPKFSTAIISVIVINQIIGPILTKYGLRASGEAGKAGALGEEEHEEEEEAGHEGDEQQLLENKDSSAPQSSVGSVASAAPAASAIDVEAIAVLNSPSTAPSASIAIIAGVDGFSMAMVRRLCSAASIDKVLLLDQQDSEAIVSPMCEQLQNLPSVVNKLIRRTIPVGAAPSPVTGPASLASAQPLNAPGAGAGMLVSEFTRTVANNNVNLVILNFDNDDANLLIGGALRDMHREKLRVVARIHNPKRADEFAFAKVHGIYPFSATVQVVNNLCFAPTATPLRFLNKPLDEESLMEHLRPEENSGSEYAAEQPSDNKHHFRMDFVVREATAVGEALQRVRRAAESTFDFLSQSAIGTGGIDVSKSGMSAHEKKETMNLM